MSKEKSPAFQFFPRDFLADENVAAMDMTQRGIYITLLCFCWLERSIPADPGRVLKMCQAGPEYEGVLQPVLDCFIPMPDDPNRLIHQRHDRERAEQAERRRRRQEAGKKGGRPRGLKAPSKSLPKQSESNASAKKSSSSSSAPADEDPPTPLAKTQRAAVRPLAGTNGRHEGEADSVAGEPKPYQPYWRDEQGNLKPEFEGCGEFTDEEIAEAERQVFGGDR